MKAQESFVTLLPSTEASAPQPLDAPGGAVVRFGRFCAIPGARQLLADGKAVELGGRAFDLLMALLNARGTVLPKSVILNQVWPATAVEESNLRFQIAALRRALGADRDIIKTVAGRGYILAVEIDQRALSVSQNVSLTATTNDRASGGIGTPPESSC